jgi:hypothetical protein
VRRSSRRFAPAEAVRKGDGQAVRVYRTADANALKSARLEIGQGEDGQDLEGSWVSPGNGE